MIKDYQVEAVVDCLVSAKRPGPTREYAKWILEAAYAAKAPEPVEEVVCTQKMKDAGGAVYLQYLMNTARGDMVADLDGLALAYTAMFKARPKEVGIGGACAPEVSDEAVKAYFQGARTGANYQSPPEDFVRRGLAAALPYLSRHKPDIEVYKLNGEDWVWCDDCKCSYGPGSCHASDTRKTKHKRSGNDRRNPGRRKRDEKIDRRQTQGTQT